MNNAHYLLIWRKQQEKRIVFLCVQEKPELNKPINITENDLAHFAHLQNAFYLKTSKWKGALKNDKYKI